jgi:hypothetical protein
MTLRLFAPPTTAQRVAAQFGDGTILVDAAGRSLLLACIDAGLRSQAIKVAGGYAVYAFIDGSAIVEFNGVWDVRAVGCSQHCWDGAGCTCEVAP